MIDIRPAPLRSVPEILAELEEHGFAFQHIEIKQAAGGFPALVLSMDFVNKAGPDMLDVGKVAELYAYVMGRDQ